MSSAAACWCTCWTRATLESDRDPVSDLDIIEEELKQYGGLEQPAAHRSR